VQLLVDAGAITLEEAKTSPRKNVILQAIGTAPTLTAAIGRLLLRRGDRLLVCCDGLSNELTEEELAAIMAEPDPAAASEHAITAANAHGGNDNITAIIAHIGGDAIPEAAPGEHITATYRVVQDYGRPGT
jgi:serine/threonine protein phosphatase PrpC